MELNLTMFSLFFSINHAYMHSFINNFFHKKSKDLTKFFLNIKGMGLVRINTKKYNFKKS